MVAAEETTVAAGDVIAGSFKILTQQERGATGRVRPFLYFSVNSTQPTCTGLPNRFHSEGHHGSYLQALLRN